MHRKQSFFGSDEAELTVVVVSSTDEAAYSEDGELVDSELENGSDDSLEDDALLVVEEAG
jgi:hypothetical protein